MAAAPVLEFERPLAELEKQIEELKRLASERSLNVDQELEPLQRKLSALRQWYIVLCARVRTLEYPGVPWVSRSPTAKRPCGSRSVSPFCMSA